MKKLFCDFCTKEIASIDEASKNESFSRIESPVYKNIRVSFSFNISPYVQKSETKRSFEHICTECGWNIIKMYFNKE